MREGLLLAYHNDPKIKELYLTRVRAHQAHDEIVKGTYWEEGKGCAVGCTIEGDEHSRYETELGIPVQIAYLEDTLFEGMSNERAKEFPTQFLSSIHVGADLSLVIPKFYLEILLDKEHGVRNVALEDGKKAIDLVAKVHRNHIKTGVIDEKKRLEAELAAVSAAKSEGWPAWSAGAAVNSTVWSLRSTEWSAAWSAAAAAEASVIRYNWMADTLLRILSETT